MAKSSRIKKASFDKYKKILLEKRSLLVNDIQKMEESALAPSKSFEEDGAFEREILFGLIESQENIIREIDEALKRIADKSFSICSECEKPISSKRLLAKPSSRMCLKCRIIYEEKSLNHL